MFTGCVHALQQRLHELVVCGGQGICCSQDSRQLQQLASIDSNVVVYIRCVFGHCLQHTVLVCVNVVRKLSQHACLCVLPAHKRAAP
jgi:hypothetical protein